MLVNHRRVEFLYFWMILSMLQGLMHGIRIPQQDLALKM